MSDKPTVMFVDDEDGFLMSMRRMLTRQRDEWAVMFVTDPAEAIREATEGRIDAILADVKMPGMSGLDMLRSLREREETRDIPVAVLTALEDDGLKRTAVELGASDLLSKPIHPQDLFARIRNMLQLKAQQDELKSLNKTLEERVRQRTAELERARLEVIWRLAKTGEFRDEETGTHVVRVGCYCRLLAEEMGMARSFVEAIFLTSPLHDIGKIGIPDKILLKRGKLNQEEQEVIQSHCRIGLGILHGDPLGMKPFLDWRGDGSQPHGDGLDPLLEMACSIALSHHERWDGTGYPEQLAGEEIPLEARIAAIADVYDAVTSERTYKQAYPHPRALEIMQAEAEGNQLDPAAYEAFLARQDEFREIRANVPDGAAARPFARQSA